MGCCVARPFLSTPRGAFSAPARYSISGMRTLFLWRRIVCIGGMAEVWGWTRGQRRGGGGELLPPPRAGRGRRVGVHGHSPDVHSRGVRATLSLLLLSL